MRRGYIPGVTGEPHVPRPLDGRWAVRREGGLLPPLGFVEKRIEDRRGVTRAGPISRPFRVRAGARGPELAYTGPLSFVHDRLHRRDDDVWGGETFIAGVRIGRFRMVRIGSPDPARDASTPRGRPAP